MVTVQSLRPKTLLPVRLLCFPLMIIFNAVYIFMPVIFALWRFPKTLLSWSGWVQLASYLIHAIPGDEYRLLAQRIAKIDRVPLYAAYLATVFVVIAHVLPPFLTHATHETTEMRDKFVSLFSNMLKARPNLGFDETGYEVYEVNM